VVPLLTSAPIKLMQADACAGYNAHIRTESMVSTAQQDASYMAPAVSCESGSRAAASHTSIQAHPNAQIATLIGGMQPYPATLNETQQAHCCPCTHT
jgi:hypothetical protein